MKTPLSFPLFLAIALFTGGCTPLISEPSPPTSEASPETLGQSLPLESQVTIGDQTIFLEIARTWEQQQVGLMYRPGQPDDRGMLFPFEPPRPVSFWMKNVEFNLDIIFLRHGEVVAIADNVPPCAEEPCALYPSDGVIDLVLELRGGLAQELGLKVGDRLEFEDLEPGDTIPKATDS